MTETEIQEEHSEFANSLKDAMSQALGKQPEPKEEVVENEVVEKEEPPVADEVAQEKEEHKEEQPTKIEEEFKLIPKEWTKKEQEVFQEALDNPDLKEASEAFISRYENLRKDYHRKAGERAELAKKQSVWDDVFDDKAKEALRQKGIDEPEYVKRLLNVEKSLIANPAETIKKLADVYNVDLKQTVDSVNDDVVDYDKTITEMKKEIANLKNKDTQTKEQAAATEQSYIAKQVKDFEFAIDDTGELKHPLFKEVKDEMGIILQKGKAKTLEEAYNLSPTVRSAALEKKVELQSREDIEAERRKVSKAKKAAKGVTNKKIVTAQNIKMSLEDRLKEKFAEARAVS